MHLKSCSKLVRSELRLDLGQQQGTLLRRSHSHRLPLASLSTNTLRCGPQGGTVHGGAARSKGSENCAVTDDDGTVLDVWSVIRPGHVREKIALFGHDTDRNVKGSWDITAKRRRRASQIPPLPQSPMVTVTLQPVPLASDLAPSLMPSDTPLPSDIISGAETDPKLSVVEMVAFLEQRVTCSPHAKLRSSASITLSRAPPLSSSSSLPTLIHAPSDPRSIAAEEPESVSVSDMVAKLESQCLRRRSQNEHRTVGRVLLAEQQQQHLHRPVSRQSNGISEAFKTPPRLENRTTSHISVCKQDSKINTSFVTEMKVLKALATPISPERSDCIGRGRMDPQSPSSQIKESKSEPVLQICKLEKTLAANKPNLSVIHNEELNSAAILTPSVRSDVNTKAETSKEVKSSVEKDSSLKIPKLTLAPQNSPLYSRISENTLSHEEPLPGLLFLTPPLNPCVQTEQRTFVHSAPITLNPDSLPERRDKADTCVVLSLDLTIQSQTRMQPSPSPAPSYTSIAPGQSQKRKRQPCDPTVQSEEGGPHDPESERTFRPLQNDVCSLSQWEKRKSCPVQSESRIEVVPTESQLHRRRLNRIAQAEKRRSCPVTALSDWLKCQDETRKSESVSDSLALLSADSSQSETGRRMAHPLTGPTQLEMRASGSVLLRSSSDVGVDRRRRRKATRAFSLCTAEGAGHYCEGAGRAASEDFLLMRRRLQNLLEPRTRISYLSLLPHHLLVHILSLLPTRALAALKCSCRYLRLIIDTYDPRPLDALWVCDPRYRDDPCKQCKRRHQRGDVSLCRWHHKPFCQAMPYGPGYWMCCHGDRRDAPGCNVGLHDNRWVPAFHSINVPIYRQRQREEERENQD